MSIPPKIQFILNPITRIYFKPRGERVVSTERMTVIQALERKSVDKLMKLGQLVKQEFEYIRHGTQALIVSFDIGSGKIVHESIGQTRTELDFGSHL